MPSKEEMCVIGGGDVVTTTTASQDFMEELVSEIKENLRLSGFKARPAAAFALHRKSRASPYKIPSRGASWGDKKSKQASASPDDDPYEMLQELLRDGSLIKEAVRRLQRGLSPKQRYFYDSDEETCSPLKMCQLEI